MCISAMIYTLTIAYITIETKFHTKLFLYLNWWKIRIFTGCGEKKKDNQFLIQLEYSGHSSDDIMSEKCTFHHFCVFWPCVELVLSIVETKFTLPKCLLEYRSTTTSRMSHWYNFWFIFTPLTRKTRSVLPLVQIPPQTMTDFEFLQCSTIAEVLGAFTDQILLFWELRACWTIKSFSLVKRNLSPC